MTKQKINEDVMKTAYEILSRVKNVLLSPQFMEKYKIRPEDFSRKPTLTFTILLVFILNGIKKSIQVQLNAFIDIARLPHISKQAFSDARVKIDSRAFVDLNNILVREYYTNNQFKTYHGYILASIDGSTLQLPNSLELKEYYGVATNGNTQKEMVMARTAHVYDVLNGITIFAYLEPYKTSERQIYFKLVKDISNFKDQCSIEKVLLLLDRGFPSIGVFAAALTSGLDFVARCKHDFLSRITRKMIEKKQKDKVFECKDLWSKMSWKHKRETKRYGLNLEVLNNTSFRIMIIDLPTGEKEILITSLIDQENYKYKEFAALYCSRWGIEEDYKFKKVRIEIENFSGITKHAISQDFHATIFSLNAHQLIVNDAQEELQEAEKKHKNDKKYDYKINKNVSMGAFKDEIIFALLDPKHDLKAFYLRAKAKSIQSVVPIRPGRQSPRIVKQTRRKYHMNKRRCV